MTLMPSAVYEKSNDDSRRPKHRIREQCSYGSGHRRKRYTGHKYLLPKSHFVFPLLVPPLRGSNHFLLPPSACARGSIISRLRR